MKITQKWLSDKSACSEGVDWFAGCGETSSFKVLAKLRSEKHWTWFNWLIVRLMHKPQRVRYAIFAAQQVLPIFEKRTPNDDRPRKAIEAALNWVEHPTEENRNVATSAAASASAADAADAADAASVAAYAASVAAYAASASASAADAADYAASAASAAADAASASAAREKMRNIIADYGMKILKEKKLAKSSKSEVVQHQDKNETNL